MKEENVKDVSIYSITYNILYKIESIKDSPSGKALLANIRSSINRPISESVDSLAFVFENVPEEFLGIGENFTYQEKSIITAIQLYAMHQQAISESVILKSNGEKWRNIGYSLSYLRNEGDSKAVERRFNAMVTSSTFDELSHHLRQMIKIMKSKSKGQIKVDYAKLAEDLYFFLLGNQNGIKLNWSRAFYNNEGEKNEKK